MTEPGNTAANASKTRKIKAGFVRLLSEQIRGISGDPKQMRELVYELARIKLLEQFTHADARESRDFQKVLEQAIEEVERSFERSAAAAPVQNVAKEATSNPPPSSLPSPPPIPAAAAVSTVAPVPAAAEAPRRPVAPRPPARPKRSGAFTSIIRLAAVLLLMVGVSVAVAYRARLRTQLAALSQLVSSQIPTSPRATKDPEPAPVATPAPASETAERAPDGPKEPAPPAQPSMPLPTTFGVYALSDGQLQELKPVPGKIPDRRVAISAAINTPSATNLTSGDVRFIVFRADGGMDTSVTEVRVVAKVSRAMGVDATGKAAMVSAGDSWVIRSMSYPYKVGPVDDQPRMLLLQPEQEGFTLAPGRYVVVVKGMGYDFTVAGTITDPNQCVERINATNGAFYSPCPPPR